MEERVSLLLVDDEAEIRAGFRNILDWEAYGIDYLGTARNGSEALDLIRWHEPDIVITDIQMPGMNGLELLQHARIEQFECLFVILSGYDDFHYAQEAIRQGVHDYILKPVIVEEFAGLIRELTAEVIRKRLQHRQQVKLSSKLNAANKIIKQQNFISELLREELTQAQIDETLKRGDFRLHAGRCAAVVLHIYDQPRPAAAGWADTLEGSIAKTQSFLKHYYRGQKVICGPMNRSSIILFHNTESLSELYHDTRKMLNALESACNIKAFGAVGTLSDSLRQIHESFRMANQAVTWHIFPEMGPLTDTSILKSVGSQHLVKDERIFKDIKACDTEAVKRDFEDYTKLLFFTEFPPPAYLFSMYNFLIMDIRSRLPGLQSYTDDAYQAMRQFDTFAEIKAWVLGRLTEYANELAVRQAKSEDPLIQKAVEYMAENIFNKIGAEEVCQYIGYSKSYFSKYFRQKTNLNFRDYILDLKITYAQQQLKTNAHTPKELSLMLGYEEYSSFSRAFKARTGFSPSDYQKSFY